MTEILQTLKEYIPISLEEMSGIKLMNRTDTKYVTSYQILKEILLVARHDYRIQEVNGECNIAYHTIYLDTPDRDMYVTHQNGRIVREKIRIRTYVNSDLTFLEVKNRNNKGRTDKRRIRIGSIESIKEDGGDAFLRQHAWYDQSQLCLCLKTHFTVSHLLTIIKPNASQLIQELNSVAYKAEKYQVWITLLSLN